MRRLLLLFVFLLTCADARAWNAAGHRLSVLIAWQQMSTDTREFVARALAMHPDHNQWREKAGADEAVLIFAEASTWPDAIRKDSRFSDNGAESEVLPGFPDMGRHSDWHYADFDRRGRRERGQLDQRIEALSARLRDSRQAAEIAWTLPWLAHLVGDLHQPFHVGHDHDHGGNTVLVEDPADTRRPFVTLHTWWDDLPGASALRGKRLQRQAGEILLRQPVPNQGGVERWLTESRQLLPFAYPAGTGSVSRMIDVDYRQWAQRTAERRVAEAGYRLGRLLEETYRLRVSHGTPAAITPLR